MNQIVGTNLTRDFKIGNYIIRAVDNVTVSIRKGEYVTIVGESGAGKTTLVNLLTGLDRPDVGTVHIDKLKISALDEEVLANYRVFKIGFIFQNYNLISSLSALENVMFPIELAGTIQDLSEIEAKAVELLEKVGMEDRAEHLPFQLSAGEQQRIAIARALANDPEIIVADEPTANLDQRNARFMAEMFSELQKKGKTIIIVTHDEKLITQAHRVLRYEASEIVEETIQHDYFPPIEEDENEDEMNGMRYHKESQEEPKEAAENEADVEQEE